MKKRSGWSAEPPDGGSVWENNPFVDEFLEWVESPQGELSAEASEVTRDALRDVVVDAIDRKLVWSDGQRLSIDASVQRIHHEYPQLPIELIDTHLTGWLEMDFAPAHYSRAQLDELDRLTEAWIDDHYRHRRQSRP